MTTTHTRISTIVLLVWLAGVMTPARANATPLPLDGTWQVLHDFPSQPGGGSLWFTGTGIGGLTPADATPFTWSASLPVLFKITDILVVGDQFHVYDFGSLVATVSGQPDYTSLAGCVNGLTGGCHWTNQPDAAWLDPVFNQAALLFGPGSHSIAIEAFGFPTGYDDATVAFAAETLPTPEPGTLVLLGGGLLAAAARISRRRTAA